MNYLHHSNSNLQKIMTWGMNHFSFNPVYFPRSKEDFIELFEYSKNKNLKITLRGGGCSYGDASTNNQGIILDVTKYNQILDFDKKSGNLTVQSGTTIKKIWEFSIEHEFWPPVVSGTMFPTIAGALSMNIHGKNNFAVGPIGEHIQRFSFLTGKGEVLECSKTKNSELFYSAISGIGMLGVFLDVTIKLKRIYSGKMKVTPVVTKNFEEMIQYFENHYKTSDYLVGWVDGFAKNNQLGRGLIHKADHLKEGEDPNFPQNCRIENQVLPSRLFGVIPKSWMWLAMYPFSNPLGMKLINFAKFISGYLNNIKPYLQGHAEFAFLLDYVPNWKFMYKPGSLIQYQCFIPKEYALDAFKEIFSLFQNKKMVTWLAVFKKHRLDSFLLSHSVDGYSMAMDFPVTKKNKENLWKMAHEMDEIVLKNKGKFYFAKDSTLRSEIVKKYLPKEKLQKFKSLKKKYDPKSLLESDLYRRLFK